MRSWCLFSSVVWSTLTGLYRIEHIIQNAMSFKETLNTHVQQEISWFVLPFHWNEIISINGVVN